jgi:acyl-CoA synthetase (NDP forming)
VHPKAAEIEGIRTVPSLGSFKEKLDLLILAVRPDQAAGLMSEVVERDIAESVTLVPGGMGEVACSEAIGRDIRAKINQSHMKQGGGPIVMGGNSLGALSHPARYIRSSSRSPSFPSGAANIRGRACSSARAGPS